MSDAFVTLVSIQPSGSVQVETSREARTTGGKSMKQGIYPERRKNAVDSSPTTKPQE